MDAVGQRIAKLRAECGLTQQALAERIGISRVALSHIEVAMGWPNERTVTLLAGVFGYEPLELVEGTDYPLAKAERLPAFTARYTEADFQLALFAGELRWMEAAQAQDVLHVEQRTMVATWQPTLLRLLHKAQDPVALNRIRDALGALASYRG